MGGSSGGKLASANKTVAGVAGALVAITNTVNVATSKLTPFRGQSFTIKAIQTASLVLGPDLTMSILGGAGKASVTLPGTGPGGSGSITITRNTLPPQTISPWTILNPSTFGGVVLLITEYALKETIGSKYGLSYAYPWFTAIGGALIFSGVVGGVFDPGTGIRGGASAGSGPMAVAGSRGSRTAGFQGTYSGA